MTYLWEICRLKKSIAHDQYLLLNFYVYVLFISVTKSRMRDSLRPTEELIFTKSYEKHGFDAEVRKHRAIQACNVLIRQSPFSPKGSLVLSTSYIISSVGTLPVTGCYLLIGTCSCLSNSFFSVRNNQRRIYVTGIAHLPHQEKGNQSSRLGHLLSNTVTRLQ